MSAILIKPQCDDCGRWFNEHFLEGNVYIHLDSNCSGIVYSLVSSSNDVAMSEAVVSHPSWRADDKETNTPTTDTEIVVIGFLSLQCIITTTSHDDVIEWQHFPRYWSFVRGIRRSPVDSPHKGQRRRALMFSLICAWTKYQANNRGADDLKRHRAHYDVTVIQCRQLRNFRLNHISISVDDNEARRYTDGFSKHPSNF